MGHKIHDMLCRSLAACSSSFNQNKHERIIDMGEKVGVVYRNALTKDAVNGDTCSPFAFNDCFMLLLLFS